MRSHRRLDFGRQAAICTAVLAALALADDRAAPQTAASERERPVLHYGSSHYDIDETPEKTLAHAEGEITRIADFTRVYPKHARVPNGAQESAISRTQPAATASLLRKWAPVVEVDSSKPDRVSVRASFDGADSDSIRAYVTGGELVVEARQARRAHVSGKGAAFAARLFRRAVRLPSDANLSQAQVTQGNDALSIIIPRAPPLGEIAQGSTPATKADTVAQARREAALPSEARRAAQPASQQVSGATIRADLPKYQRHPKPFRHFSDMDAVFAEHQRLVDQHLANLSRQFDSWHMPGGLFSDMQFPLLFGADADLF